MTAALACLLATAALAACTDGGGAEEHSAQQLLDDANDAMSGLKSVTVVSSTTRKDGSEFSSRLTTDLESRCTAEVTWENKGATLEQIRIGETDYVRPNRAYIENWSGKVMTGSQDRWVKSPVSDARPGDGLSACTREFTSFGTAKKGDATEVDGTPARELVVTDKADKGGTYTFSVATEGEPYILEVVYESGASDDFRTTTAYSAFDEPLSVQPPADSEVLESNTGN